MWLSVMGIYNANADLFDDLALPTQLTTLKDDIVDNICLETAELEVLYPDKDILKYAIGSWSRLRLHTWQKIADALYKDYDPYVNFTRDETRTRTETRDLAGTKDIETTNTDTYNNITDARTIGTDDTVTNKATAFDSNTLATVAQQEGDTDVTDTNIKSGSLGSAGSHDEDTTDTGTITWEDTFHSQGDSALYTPTDVAEKEFLMRAMCDVIEYIKMEFKTRFCIMVY